MKLATAAGLLLLAVAPAPSLANDEYVDGMVIAQFRAERMPSATRVALEGPTPHVGIEAVDQVLRSHGCYRIEKFLATFDRETTEAGKLLERSFVIYYADSTDPPDLCEELSALSCFENVRPNRRLHKIYGGSRRFTPTDPEFSYQWNLHNPTNDDVDIDAPEAWAIERGDPSVIIGIIDSGTMMEVDSLTGTYRLHADLGFHFNPFEDSAPIGVAGYSDLNDTDGADSDDQLPIEERMDNVIGHTFSAVPRLLSDPLLRRFWKAMPHDWLYTSNGTWGSFYHGTQVASVAASIANNGYVVGVANRCKVYILRDGDSGTDVVAETNAIDMAAAFADVINMSWAYEEEPSDEAFVAAIKRATEPPLDRVLISIAGNISDSLSNVGFPGRYAEVLAVGNIGTDLQLYDSAYGPAVGHVSLVAPVGSGVKAAGYQATCQSFPCSFDENVVNFGGTSAAAPQVAGVAALVRSRFPNLDQGEVRQRLLRSAQWYWGNSSTDSLKYGTGKVNAYRALTEWGSLTSNAAWDTSDTRDQMYYISGDLTVEATGTLTIDPGVVVKVAPDHERTGSDQDRVEIVVEGTLTAIGTPAEPIIFESFTDTVATEADWVGIRFEPGSRAVLRHVIIRNASHDIVIEEFTVTDTTWTAEETLVLNADFEVASDLTIGEDEDFFVFGVGRLLVAPGNDIEVVVNGTMDVLGTSATSPAIFESSGATPGNGDWAGVRFGAGSDGVWKNLVIRHAAVDVAGVAYPFADVGWTPQKELYVSRPVELAVDTILAERGLYMAGDATLTLPQGEGLTVSGTFVAAGDDSTRPTISAGGAPWDGIYCAAGSKVMLRRVDIIGAVPDIEIADLDLVDSVWTTGETLVLDANYYVGGDLAIASTENVKVVGTGRLLVKPGQDIEVVVSGTFDVSGDSATSPAIFESAAGTPGESDWAGVRFEAGATAVWKNLVIRHATDDMVSSEFTVSDAGWTAGKTLYLGRDFSIDTDRVIASGEDLYVLGESEVQVAAGGDVDITVNGSLVCMGSATKRPVFRSSTGSPRSWDRITLAAGSAGHVIGHADIEDAELAIRSYVPVSLDNVTIKHGIDGIQASADLELTDVVIDSLSGSGVVVLGGDFSATGLEVSHANTGITQHSATSGSAIACTDSWLHDLDNAGIALTFAAESVTIRRTLVEDCQDGIKLGYQSEAVLDSCTVRDNDIGVWAFYTPDVSIQDCEIDGNTTVGVYLTLAAGTTLEASTVSNSAAGVSLLYNCGGTITGATHITGNGVGVKCDLYSDPVIESTVITGNADGVAALNGSAPDLGLINSNATCDSTWATGNSIHDNSGYHVVNLTQGITVPAEGVWWGVHGPQSGKFVGDVDYEPYDCDADPPLAPGQGMAAAPQQASDAAPEIALPKRYELALNQPNPFNPTTTIRFDVPPPGGAVRIDIFDVSGRRVTTLVDGHHSPGTHEVFWNGESRRGEPVSSGVYFVRMEAATFTRTRKAVLLK